MNFVLFFDRLENEIEFHAEAEVLIKSHLIAMQTCLVAPKLFKHHSGSIQSLIQSLADIWKLNMYSILFNQKVDYRSFCLFFSIYLTHFFTLIDIYWSKKKDLLPCNSHALPFVELWEVWLPHFFLWDWIKIFNSNCEWEKFHSHDFCLHDEKRNRNFVLIFWCLPAAVSSSSTNKC